MVVYDMLQLHVATMRKAKRAGSPENPISSDPLFGLLLPYCAATEINLVNSAMTQDRRHQLTMLSDDMISPPRLTTQLDLLLDNTGLDIVIPITLNLDGIPLDHPFRPSTNELTSLAESRSSHFCRREVWMEENELAMVVAIRRRREETAWLWLGRYWLRITVSR
jgi:hypothetical protein